MTLFPFFLSALRNGGRIRNFSRYGQYTSTDTGLIYFRARVYDPATAQFLSNDPAEPITRGHRSTTRPPRSLSVDPFVTLTDACIQAARMRTYVRALEQSQPQ